MVDTFNQRNNSASNTKIEQENIAKVRNLIVVLDTGDMKNIKEIIPDEYFNHEKEKVLVEQNNQELYIRKVLFSYSI
jgi:hypothetical protein